MDTAAGRRGAQGQSLEQQSKRAPEQPAVGELDNRVFVIEHCGENQQGWKTQRSRLPHTSARLSTFGLGSKRLPAERAKIVTEGSRAPGGQKKRRHRS